MIEYIVDRNRAGELTLYNGDFQCAENAVYTIQKGTPYGYDSFYLCAYSSRDIAYTVLPSKNRPGDYLVFRGSSPMHGTPIDYYLQSYGGDIIVRTGDSIYNEKILTVRPGSSHEYIVESDVSYRAGTSKYSNVAGNSAGTSRYSNVSDNSADTSRYPNVSGNSLKEITNMAWIIITIVFFVFCCKLASSTSVIGIILRIVAISYSASSLYKNVKEGCSSYLNLGLLIGAGIGLASVILSL